MGPRRYILVIFLLLKERLASGEVVEGPSSGRLPPGDRWSSPATAIAFCKVAGQGNFILPNETNCYIDCPPTLHEVTSGINVSPLIKCCSPDLCSVLPTMEGMEGSCRPCSAETAHENLAPARFEPCSFPLPNTSLKWPT
jgi:hypothetical protein